MINEKVNSRTYILTLLWQTTHQLPSFYAMFLQSMLKITIFSISYQKTSFSWIWPNFARPLHKMRAIGGWFAKAGLKYRSLSLLFHWSCWNLRLSYGEKVEDFLQFLSQICASLRHQILSSPQCKIHFEMYIIQFIHQNLQCFIALGLILTEKSWRKKFCETNLGHIC